MIEQSFQNFFLATTGASATLIGLLFVAVSVAPEQVVGPKALALHQVRAGLALTSFGSTLVLSLIAVMPDAHIGWPATAIGAGGAMFFVSSMRRLRAAASDQAQRHASVLLVTFLLVMLFLMSSGIWSILDSADTGPISCAGITAIGLLVLGIDRSWELVGGRTTGITGIITNRINGHAPTRITDVDAGSDDNTSSDSQLVSNEDAPPQHHQPS